MNVRIALALLSLFFIISLSTSAQDGSSSRKNYLYVHMPYFAWGGFQFAYERDLPKVKKSLFFTGGIINSNLNSGYNGEMQLRIPILMVNRQFKENSSKPYLECMYMAPYAAFSNVDADPAPGAGFVMGMKFTVNEFFYVDSFFGGGVRAGANTDWMYNSFNGVIPRIGFLTGARF